MRKNYQVCKERASDDSSISYEKKNKTEKEIKEEQGAFEMSVREGKEMKGIQSEEHQGQLGYERWVYV